MFNKQTEREFEIILLGLNEEERKIQLEMRKRAEKLDKKKREEIRVEKLRLKRLRENQPIICEHCDCRIIMKHKKRHQLSDNCRNAFMKKKLEEQNNLLKDKIKILEDTIKILEQENKELRN